MSVTGSVGRTILEDRRTRRKSPPPLSSQSIADRAPPRSSIERAAVAAIWTALDDVNSESAWWSGGRTRPATTEAAEFSLADSIDELLALLATSPRRPHGA